LKEKRNHTWCELWHDSRLGVREGCDYLTGLLDLELDSRSSVCRCGVCHTIQSQVWERDVADWLVWRWRWSGRGVWLAMDEDGLTWFRYRSVSESVNYAGWESGLEARRRTAGVWMLGLRIRTCFFFIVPP
jgi:hypothetical protein